MTPEQLARVRFLVREDAWTEWTRLHPPAAPTPEQPAPAPGAALLDMALAEYRDLRLVAAYVLETVCGDLRRQDAAAAEGLGGKTKSYEAVGEWKEEFFAPGKSALLTDADHYCTRAEGLRQQLEAEGRESRSRQRTVALSVQTGF